MKVTFVDRLPVAYGAGALETMPLGGSQSALLVLAEALAALGEDVAVAGAGMAHGERRRGVLGVSLERALAEGMPDADVAVSVNHPLGAALAARFARPPRLVHWHKNDARSPDHASVDEARRAGAHVVFCSNTQAALFRRRYGLAPAQASVIENPVAPEFLGLFGADEPVLAAKDPALLVYASAPNRGLEPLLRTLFPALRRRRPALRLEVYSGFQLSQGLRLADRRSGAPYDYEPLLAECAAAPGVAWQRGLPKPQLAARLKRAAMLCYPCNFPETSCHVALEAMAAGCMVSATAAGALPETTAGFARLTPFDEARGFAIEAFVNNTLSLFELAERKPAAAEAHLRRQVAHVNAAHAPAAIARRWQALLARRAA